MWEPKQKPKPKRKFADLPNFVKRKIEKKTARTSSAWAVKVNRLYKQWLALRRWESAGRPGAKPIDPFTGGSAWAVKKKREWDLKLYRARLMVKQRRGAKDLLKEKKGLFYGLE